MLITTHKITHQQQQHSFYLYYPYSIPLYIYVLFSCICKSLEMTQKANKNAVFRWLFVPEKEQNNHR